MLSRRTVLLALISAVAISPAQADESTPFTSEAFARAQQDGKPILVHIAASWCPTCRAQAPIINTLSSQAKFKDLVVFRLDFDAQKDVVRSFGAQMQSTLIVFRGSKEVGRSVGDTDPDGIKALLSKAIANS